MSLLFIGVNEKIINLATVSLIEDRSTEDQPVAVLTTSDGTEIELEGSDAEILFDRAEMLVAATDATFEQVKAVSANRN